MSSVVRLALRVVALLAPPPLRDPLVGDVLEEAALRGSDRWVLGQLLRSLPALLLLRARANRAALLALSLPPLAVLLPLVAVAGLENTQDLTAATMRALILQLAALAIAVALPLYLADDLDLSLGAVALLGLIWAVSRSSADAGAFFGLLPLIAAAGCAVGAANALLAVATRAPAAAVTLATGVALTAALSQTNVHLAVPTPHRLTLDGAALAAVFVAVAALVALASPARAPSADAPPPAGALRGALALLALAAAFSAAAIAELDPFGLPPAVHGAPLFGALAGPLVGAAVVLLFAALLVDPARRARVLLGGTALLLATPTVGLAVLPERVGQLMAAPLIALPLLFAVAGAVGPGAWPAALARSSGPASPRRRVVAMSVAGALAATAGAMMGAQGVRDAGFLSQGSFLALLPPIALIVGGQHALARGPARLAAAVGGALLTAALAVATAQPSDNLSPGLLTTLLLATVAAPLWRLLARRTTAPAPLADA